MEFLPIFLNVRGQSCLVVGGGDVAARKVELLLKAQASITVVAPELCAAAKVKLADIPRCSGGRTTRSRGSRNSASTRGVSLVE